MKAVSGKLETKTNQDSKFFEFFVLGSRLPLIAPFSTTVGAYYQLIYRLEIF